MIAYLKQLLATMRRRMVLHQKAHLYRNISRDLELLSIKDLNPGEEIWNRLHRQYFERKLAETTQLLQS